MSSLLGRILAILALFASVTTSAQTLVTGPASGGSGGGAFLDLQATNGPVTLTGFDAPVNGASGVTVSVEVWTRPGSYAGFTDNSSGWALSQVATAVSQGGSVGTPFLLSTPITLPAGQVTAVYLQSVTSGTGLQFTGIGGAIQTTFANADLSVTTDVARTGNLAFGGNELSPRAFSGTLRYTNALGTASANNGAGGVFLNLQAANRALAVTGFQLFVNSGAGAPTSIEVWTRPGTYQGFTGSSDGWTLTQTITAPSQGIVTPATFRLQQPIEVGPRDITAVYLHPVTSDRQLGFRGTDASPPQTLWSNGDLVLFSDRVVTGDLPFGGTQSTPRAFAGSVLYTKAFTTAPANSGDGGVFMDLRSLDGGLALTGFDLPLAGNPGVVASVEVWTRPGSYVGLADSSAGWTLHGVVNGLTQGPEGRTPFLMSAPLPISSSTMTAVYLHGVTAGAGIRHTDSTGAPLKTLWANSDLGLSSDVARSGNIPFAGATLTPRTFSGVLRYSVDRMFRDGFED